MRVLKLEIGHFKNLRNFVVDFDRDSPVSVIVGRNGVGKSNILEALTLIFRDLDLGLAASFTYTVEYECRGKIIHVEGDEGSRRYRVQVDGVSTSARLLVGLPGSQLRPDFVFGYYSGPSNRLERHFQLHQDRFYRDLLDGKDDPLRPLFYARGVHSNFVLLAFFLENDPLVSELLKDHLGIDGLDSVMFELQQPGWRSRSGDLRFWNARGVVASFLSNLWDVALAPMRLTVRGRADARRTLKSERLFLFLEDVDALRALRNGYPRDQDFFKALESTYISDLISDVRIRVRIRKAPAPLTFRELSEGEQQLLLVLGLMRFTQEEESLFLLDEPDTHLNPAWSAQYRRFLDRFGSLDKRSHVIMATHDPLVVSALRKEEVSILVRDAMGMVRAHRPDEDPQGMGVSNLLTSDIYGLRAALDIETTEKIDRKRILSVKSGLTREEKSELSALSSELRTLGFMLEDDDPDYAEFLRVKFSGARPLPHDSVMDQAEMIDLARTLIAASVAKDPTDEEG